MNTVARPPSSPRAARRQLEAAVFLRSPNLRTIQMAAFLLPFWLYVGISRALDPEHSFYIRYTVGLIASLSLSALIWGCFGQRLLRREMNRLRIDRSNQTA